MPNQMPRLQIFQFQILNACDQVFLMLFCVLRRRWCCCCCRAIDSNISRFPLLTRHFQIITVFIIFIEIQNRNNWFDLKWINISVVFLYSLMIVVVPSFPCSSFCLSTRAPSFSTSFSHSHTLSLTPFLFHDHGPLVAPLSAQSICRYLFTFSN